MPLDRQTKMIVSFHSMLGALMRLFLTNSVCSILCVFVFTNFALSRVQRDRQTIHIYTFEFALYVSDFTSNSLLRIDA